MKISLRQALLLLSAAMTGAAASCSGAPDENANAKPLPDMPPLFKPEGVARQEPVFKCIAYSSEREKGRMLSQLSWNVGRKSVDILRHGNWIEPWSGPENRVYINKGDRWLGTINFKGGTGANAGWPFKELENDPPKLSFDQTTKESVYRKPYLTKSGEKAVFSYSLKPAGKSRVELSWDSGSDDAISPVFSFSEASGYRASGVTLGGEKAKFADESELLAGKAKPKETFGDIVFAPDEPLDKFSLETGGAKFRFTEGARKDSAGDVQFSARAELSSARSGKIMIDLGESEVPNAAETPQKSVGGIDFWKEDAILLPSFATRNIMPNPSFEQGLRYWTWHSDGKYLNGKVDPEAWSLSDDALFGKKSLRCKNPPENARDKAPSLVSFPMQLEKDQSYVISFYAKTPSGKPAQVKMSLASAALGGKLAQPKAPFTANGEWKRFSQAFVADQFGFKLILRSDAETLFDGIQLEKGDVATEFVCNPLEGRLATADPENAIVSGQPLNASFVFSGKPGAKGSAELEISNVYREVLWTKKLAVAIGPDGQEQVKLDLSEDKLGKGIFVLKTKFDVAGFEPVIDFHRFSIMTPLDNTHSTATIPGTLMNDLARLPCAEEFGRKLKEWGFGSTSWVMPASKDGLPPPKWQSDRSYVDNSTLIWSVLKKNKIKNVHDALWSQMIYECDFPGKEDALKKAREGAASLRFFVNEPVNAECEKNIENAAYEMLKNCDPESCLSVGWGNEEESSDLPAQGKFAEYLKYQAAVARGAKRANPQFRVAPTCGTAGYSKLRGHDAMEGYLKAADEAGVKYDAVAVHPYGNIDGGWFGPGDMDAESVYLIETMKRHGLGSDVPIYYTECGNNSPIWIPQWRTESGDAYNAGKPSYSWNDAEFVMAASYLRLWICCLKHWPQVQSTNVWIFRPFMDAEMAPMFLCKAANTFGRLLPWAEFVADVRPAGGVRGYAFRLKDGTGIAPIWFVSYELEKSMIDCPKLKVKFNQPVEFVDMNENSRSAKPDAEGWTEIPLTAAPLFIKAKDPQLLAKDLQNGELENFAASFQLSFEPEVDGSVRMKLKSMVGRQMKGVVKAGEQEIPFELPGLGEKTAILKGFDQGAEQGKLFKARIPWSIRSGKKETSGDWSMDYFYAPKVSGAPDWDKIPAIQMTNYEKPKLACDNNERMYDESSPSGLADFSAQYKVAWDEDNFYLRVEAKDDEFLTFPERWKRGAAMEQLWVHDGCLEVYFDCGANGRLGSKREGYDRDDYRYDFCINKNLQDGPGTVNRFIEVDHQLADGVNMPTKQEAAEKVKCDFRRVPGGYVYTIVFGKRYLEPLALKRGFVAGFALYLHDMDGENGKSHKGLTTGIEPGKHCQMRPFDWPLMILK